MTEVVAQALPGSHQAELAAILQRHARCEGVQAVEAIPSMFIFRATTTSDVIHSLYEPSICVVAQGSKELMVGSEMFTYDTEHFLLVSVSLPISARMLVASPEQPHLAMHVNLDTALLLELAMQLGDSVLSQPTTGPGLGVHRLTPMISDAMLRLARLLDTPQHIQVLAPLILRELSYLLLTGSEGAKLRELVVSDGQAQRVARVIERLRRSYREPLRVEQLARETGMSVAGLHRHFKAVTAMSPLQYQKMLRLHEARRLMLGEHLDATTASVYVGYESASQFSREYSRLFGAPPARDIAQIRASAFSE